MIHGNPGMYKPCKLPSPKLILSMPDPIVPSFDNAQEEIVTNQTIQGQRALAAGKSAISLAGRDACETVVG
ncbi:hypothetical protein BO78DRAFT_396326 [Aspergillus sclerotiicarbonarius CBS 121057]|uniref:Uncharacterized protein n=1 Tax=Aspergillus sclerotiicarbonarius (strain CBS 121057 / IBT 28362) TaxID=1448318 RepID=A0A319EBI6_ASPSB|nr:hypothetical protein BO78DRAFT_396326 [Aspergillus sclerotiicarbonarius CBS 121057]